MIISSGDTQSSGKKAFGQTPIPARPDAEATRVKAARTLGCGNRNDLKCLNLFLSQWVDKIQSRMPKTAGNTVEKGSVAYQKYSDELNSGPI
ncbi:unnamed protein product [marine sediment metagenome]|uniref:Uncharacterized protein n=1 Tax=marine sediment metagenome TaxID=412755 RepID=X1T3K6_9ZZZZ